MIQKNSEINKQKSNTVGKRAGVVIPHEIHKQLRFLAVQHECNISDAVVIALKEYFKLVGAADANRVA